MESSDSARAPRCSRAPEIDSGPSITSEIFYSTESTSLGCLGRNRLLIMHRCFELDILGHKRPTKARHYALSKRTQGSQSRPEASVFSARHNVHSRLARNLQAVGRDFVRSHARPRQSCLLLGSESHRAGGFLQSRQKIENFDK